LHLIKAGENFS